MGRSGHELHVSFDGYVPGLHAQFGQQIGESCARFDVAGFAIDEYLHGGRRNASYRPKCRFYRARRGLTTAETGEARLSDWVYVPTAAERPRCAAVSCPEKRTKPP